MTDLIYDDDELLEIFERVKTIAVVGASPRWVRPSNFVIKYMLNKGYKVIPVNPGHAGTEILEQTVYATLADIPGPIDMVDIFRGSDAAAGVVDDTIALAADKRISVVWMQLGVRNDAAAKRAQSAGLTMIMDRCPKIEYGRLFGELGWGGVNTGIISARRTARH